MKSPQSHQPDKPDRVPADLAPAESPLLHILSPGQPVTAKGSSANGKACLQIAED